MEDSLLPSDFEKLAFLRDRLRNQKDCLDKALTGMRELLVQNFTIQDLEYIKRF